MSDITVQTYTDFEATATSSKSSKGINNNQISLKNYVKLQCIFSHYFLETSPSVENSSATSSSRRSTKDNTPLDGATTASATSDTINFVSGNPFVEVTKGMNKLIFFP